MFITQSYFSEPKDVGLNTTHFFNIKIPKNQEIQQIAMDYLSGIDSKDFRELYRKYTADPYSFLVIDTTLPSDSPLHFWKNLLEEVYRIIMTINDKIRDEKLQCDCNRVTAMISALLSGQVDTYEYLTGEEILPPQQESMVQEAKFFYSPIGKALEKQTKTIDEHG